MTPIKTKHIYDMNNMM